MDVWMVWVAGQGSPKHMHESYESAITEARRLQTERKITREIYIFRTHEVLPGRKLIKLKRTACASKVET